MHLICLSILISNILRVALLVHDCNHRFLLFHDLNLLWSTGQPSRVSAVLDWDRLRVGPLAAEVVRTASLISGYDQTPELRALDLERVAAFTAGYRELIPLSRYSGKKITESRMTSFSKIMHAP